MLIDTHCHLHFRAYDNDREEVIRRAREAGVFMITVGTSRETSEAAVKLALANDGIWSAVGLHPSHLFAYPHDSDEDSAHTIEKFDADVYRKLAKNKKVVAIGECGLDFYRIPKELDETEVKKAQEELFRVQLDLADELNLPVIVHCRDAHAEVQGILKEYLTLGKLSRRGVIHCFTGTKEEAENYLPLGFLISFTGIITFPPRKNHTESFSDVVNAVPLDKLMAETDAPYLAPEPFRGKRNEPAYVREIAQKIADIIKTTFDQVESQTWKNAQALFNLS